MRLIKERKKYFKHDCSYWDQRHPQMMRKRAVLNTDPTELKSSEAKETFILKLVGSRTGSVTDGPCQPSDIFSSINLRHVCAQLSFILSLRITTTCKQLLLE